MPASISAKRGDDDGKGAPGILYPVVSKCLYSIADCFHASQGGASSGE